MQTRGHPFRTTKEKGKYRQYSYCRTVLNMNPVCFHLTTAVGTLAPVGRGSSASLVLSPPLLSRLPFKTKNSSKQAAPNISKFMSAHTGFDGDSAAESESFGPFTFEPRTSSKYSVLFAAIRPASSTPVASGTASAIAAPPVADPDDVMAGSTRKNGAKAFMSRKFPQLFQSRDRNSASNASQQTAEEMIAASELLCAYLLFYTLTWNHRITSVI